jgi:hypothetical protein
MRLLEKLIKKLGQGGSIDDLVRQVRKQRKGGGKAKIVASPKKLKEAQTAASDGGPEGAVEKVTFDGATTGSKTLDLNTAKVG